MTPTLTEADRYATWGSGYDSHVMPNFEIFECKAGSRVFALRDAIVAPAPPIAGSSFSPTQAIQEAVLMSLEGRPSLRAAVRDLAPDVRRRSRGRPSPSSLRSKPLRRPQRPRDVERWPAQRPLR